MSLSRNELNRLTGDSVDPTGFGPVRSHFENVDLTDEELVQRIKERNRVRKPTYKLRLEYERRLKQRGLW
jgi:hypothetical protein